MGMMINKEPSDLLPGALDAVDEFPGQSLLFQLLVGPHVEENKETPTARIRLSLVHRPVCCCCWCLLLLLLICTSITFASRSIRLLWLLKIVSVRYIAYDIINREVFSTEGGAGKVDAIGLKKRRSTVTTFDKLGFLLC